MNQNQRAGSEDAMLTNRGRTYHTQSHKIQFNKSFNNLTENKLACYTLWLLLSLLPSY